MRWWNRNNSFAATVTFLIIVILVGFLATIIIATSLFATLLPGYLDEFLLTNDEFCHSLLLLENDNIYYGTSTTYTQRKKPPVQIDYGGYKFKLDESAVGRERKPQPTGLAGQDRDSLKQRILQSILKTISLHLWQQSTKEDDDSKHNVDDASSTTTCMEDMQGTTLLQSKEEMNPATKADVNTHKTTRDMHPMCNEYRMFRTRLRFKQLLLPWNWHYRTWFQLKGLTLHSLADKIEFVPRDDNSNHDGEWWWGWLDWSSANANAARVTAVNNTHSPHHEHHEDSSTKNSMTHYLPPTIEVDTMEISFESWTRPIISAQLHGITINILVQKGRGLPLAALQKIKTPRDIEKLANGSAVLFGAMPIQEVIQLIPKPPDLEGLYPRIGLVNVTNVILNVYENKKTNSSSSSSSISSSLNLVLKMRVPDNFFLPITNLTLAHKQNGIDRKHFQPMMESSIATALRGHLLREATTAIRNSWAHAHKAKEQLQQFVLETQEVYLDRWIGNAINAWHQTQENVWRGMVNHGTVVAPLVRAVDDWISDIKEIVTEPGVPPLAVVASHYWNQTMEGINKYTPDKRFLDIDKQHLLSHLNQLLVIKSNNVKHRREKKKKSKHLGDLQDAFDRFMAKSGPDLELFVQSCELEVKELWLAWHRQFLPEL